MNHHESKDLRDLFTQLTRRLREARLQELLEEPFDQFEDTQPFLGEDI